MRRIQLLTLVILTAAAGVGGVALLLLRGEGNRTVANEPAASEKLRVKVVLPRQGALERICVQPGSVQAFESVRLYAKVPGFLQSQTVDIGSHVKTGEKLALVYVPDIKALVERNAAAVEKAEAKLAQMKTRVEVAGANFAAAQAAVVQAEARLRADQAWVKYRNIQLGRMQELVKDTAVEERIYDESKERHDSAVEAVIASNAAIVTAKASVSATKAKMTEAQADVVEAEAEIKLARAELKRAQVDLDFATVTAPYTGVITHRGMNPGDFVKAADGSPSIEPLFTIDRSDLFRVVVLVPERDVRFIHIGTPATMEIDALPGGKFPMTVARFANSLDKRTRLMRVEFDLPNPTGEIYNDMYGQVTIVLERGTDLLSIPSLCLAGKPSHGRGSVYVVRSGQAEKVDVELLIDTGVRVAVKGLAADDQVILSPSSSMSGQPVHPVLSKE